MCDADNLARVSGEALRPRFRLRKASVILRLADSDMRLRLSLPRRRLRFKLVEDFVHDGGVDERPALNLDAAVFDVRADD